MQIHNLVTPPVRLPGVKEMLRGDSCDTDVSFKYPSQECVSQPRSTGWFDVDQQEVMRAIDLTRGMSRNDLFDMAFSLDQERALYQGEKTSFEQILDTDSPDQKHRKCERNRRIRHKVWQETAHTMTCDLAHDAVKSDLTYYGGKHGGGRKPKGVRKVNGEKIDDRKPGKDEQLCSIIYTVALLGIVIQSENEGRRQAEERALEAERRLALLETSTTRTSRKRSLNEDDLDALHLPNKRPAIQPPMRLPPSPSPTACHSPSPTPTLSACSSFGH